MAYTQKQARSIARQIFDRFGAAINAACAESAVRPEFLAGLIGVEAGKDRHGQIQPSATRFEPHVFAKLKALRSGEVAAYNKITRDQIADATDDALKALATSYGLCQIMGYHVINTLGGIPLAELQNPDTHLPLAVKMLLKVAKPYLTKDEFGKVLRIWNTGRPNGKTYDDDYVQNATAVGLAFSQIENPPKVNSASGKITLEPKTNIVVEPPPYNQIGFWKTIKGDLFAAFGGNLTLATVSQAVQQTSSVPEWLIPIAKIIAAGALVFTAGWFFSRLVHFAIDSWKQGQRTKAQAAGVQFVKPL